MEGLLEAQTDQTCRTCMKSSQGNTNGNFLNETNQLQSIYDSVYDCDGKTIQIHELLNCTVPKLPKIEMLDELPKIICAKCLEKLKAYYEFQICCLKSDLQLRNSMQKVLVEVNLKQDLPDPLHCNMETSVKQEKEILDEADYLLYPEVKSEPILDVICINATESDDNQIGANNVIAMGTSEAPRNDSYWRCESCLLCFLHKSQLKMHFKSNSTICCGNATQVIPERYYCEMCDVSFTEKKNLQRHTLNKHNLDTRIRKIQRRPKRSKNEVTNEQKSHPPMEQEVRKEDLANEINLSIKVENGTNMAFSSENQTDIRLTTDNIEESMHKDIKKEVCFIEGENESSNDNNTESSEKELPESGAKDRKSGKWECKICLNLFNHKKSLMRHIRGKHNEEPSKDTQALSAEEHLKRLTTTHKCDKCDMEFPNIKAFIVHKRHHLKNTCQYCNKTFKKLDKMKQHERTHGTEKPYLCADCGKTFAKRDGFTRHRARHENERRHQCPQCPKKFFVRQEISRHIRQVHNTNKPCVCEVCGAGFKQPYCLRAHLLTHTRDYRYQCDYCDKRFPAKEPMERHRRTHTGEKPFECQYCSRCYKSPSDLRKHLGTHLDKKTFLCELCPEAFHLARDMRAHFATHRHDDEETKARNMKARLEAQEKIKMKIASESSLIVDKPLQE